MKHTYNIQFRQGGKVPIVITRKLRKYYSLLKTNFIDFFFLNKSFVKFQIGLKYKSI